MLKKIDQIFRRDTNSVRFIPEIDGLRFVAIITVILYHLNTAYARQINQYDVCIDLLGGDKDILKPGWWIVRLDMGVKIFFSISGFILSIPFLRHFLYNDKRPSFKAYFYKRLTRLEPPFFISSLLLLFAHFHYFQADYLFLIKHFIAGIFYLHVFVFGKQFNINPVSWSLEVEAQFYLFLPILFLFLFSRYRRGAFFLFIFLFIFSIILKSYTFNVYPRIYLSVLVFFSNFFIGILFAYVYLRYSVYLKTKNMFWDLVSLFSLFIIFYFYKPQDNWINHLMFCIGTFIFMISAFKGYFINRFFNNRFVYLTGGMCYSIYLLHYGLLYLILRYTAPITIHLPYALAYLLQMFISIPFLLIISSFFYVIIEKPCMNKNWPQQLIQYLKKSRSYSEE